MYRIIISLVLALCVFDASAQSKVKSSLVWDISDASACIQQDSVVITLIYQLIDDGVSRGAYIRLSPQLRWIDRLFPMTSLNICSFDMESGPKDGIVTMTGKGPRKVTVVSKVPYDEGMDHFSISVLLSEHKDDRHATGERRQVAVFGRKTRPKLEMDLFLVKPPRLPEGQRTTVIELQIPSHDLSDGNGIVSKEGKESYKEFASSVRKIVLDQMTKVSSIRMSALTGISGKEDDNRRVANSRLKKLVGLMNEQGVFGRKKVTTAHVGEDWNSLSKWLAGSFWGDDSDIRSLLSGTETPDRKEKRLREDYPQVWQSMSESLFPQMERFSCELVYTVNPLTDKKVLLDVYKMEPRILEPLDFYNLLECFEPYSYGWNEAILCCTRVWPESEHACINAASALLGLGRNHEAGSYLRRCGDSDEAWYFRAVHLARLGNIEAAEALVRDLPDTREEFRKVKDILKEAEGLHYTDTPWEVTLYGFGREW